MREGRAAFNDPGKIIRDGKKYVVSASDNAVITVPVKSTFYISGKKGTAKCLGSGKMLKISKKGKVNAMKTASLFPIRYTDLTGDKEVNLKLNIIAPVIDGKKNLSEDVKMDTAFDLVTSIPQMRSLTLRKRP